MRIVDRPVTRPQRCAVFPQYGQTANVQWIDTGSELPGFDNHVYVSGPAVEEMARLLGWVPGGELRQAREDAGAILEKYDAMKAERDELQARLDAIDVIESEGFRARKKAGRPRKAEEVAA